MSATLRVDDFMPNSARKIQLFSSKPPLIKVESRQFDVNIHFNRKTPSEEGEYIEEAFKKVCKIHKTLPEGGILVFVTGQDEVKQLMKKLKITFPSQNNEDKIIDEDAILDKAIKASKKLPKVDLNSYSTKPDEENDEMLEENDVTGNSLSDQQDNFQINPKYNGRSCMFSTCHFTLNCSECTQKLKLIPCKVSGNTYIKVNLLYSFILC